MEWLSEHKVRFGNAQCAVDLQYAFGRKSIAERNALNGSDLARIYCFDPGEFCNFETRLLNRRMLRHTNSLFCGVGNEPELVL